MEKTLEQKVQIAREEYLDFWFAVKITGDTQDMRLLIDCAEKYFELLKQLEERNKMLDERELT